MEDLYQKIEDLIEELIVLKENDDFDGSQLDDVIYELNNIQETIKTIEDC